MKISKSIFFTLLLLIFSANVFATAQFPDKIIYNGKTHSLHSNPLSEYFKKHPEKKPQSGIISSALWRGYVANFEVENDTLYLKDIHIQVSKKDSKDSFEIEWKSQLDKVVPKGERLKIDWVTGILVIPQGKIINYVHMGYASTYEKYTLLEMDKGELKKAKSFTHKTYAKFKSRQYEAFKKTQEYKKLVADFKKNKNYSDEYIDRFLKNFVLNYTSTILVD